MPFFAHSHMDPSGSSDMRAEGCLSDRARLSVSLIDLYSAMSLYLTTKAENSKEVMSTSW